MASTNSFLITWPVVLTSTFRQWPLASLELSLVVLVSIGIVGYRTYFHPLAKVPGPKIAAATGLYEFWYDVVKRGRYVSIIEDMHVRYGMFYRSIKSWCNVHRSDRSHQSQRGVNP